MNKQEFLKWAERELPEAVDIETMTNFAFREKNGTCWWWDGNNWISGTVLANVQKRQKESEILDVLSRRLLAFVEPVVKNYFRQFLFPSPPPSGPMYGASPPSDEL